jgi:hypothetical protein
MSKFKGFWKKNIAKNDTLEIVSWAMDQLDSGMSIVQLVSKLESKYGISFEEATHLADQANNSFS